MILYQGAFLSISYEKENNLFVQKWSSQTISMAGFKLEMLKFVSFYEKYRPQKALWLQKEFLLILGKESYDWIDKNVNQQCSKYGNEKCAFVVGKDVFSHVSVIDSFNDVESAILVKHFLTEKDAREWLCHAKEGEANSLKPKIVFDNVNENGDLVFKIENSKNRVDEALMLFMSEVEVQQFSNLNLDNLLKLTKREKEVFKLIAEGKTGTQIAEILFISKNTSRTHWHNIKVKLSVNSSKDIQLYYKLFKLNNL